MTHKTHRSHSALVLVSANRTRRQLLTAFFVLLIAATFFAVTVSSASAQMLPGVEFGMSYKDVRRILRQVKRDDKADFTTTIANITLGLDFMHGAPIFTVDTGVIMANAWGYYPMFFYKDRLFGVKRRINTMRDFTALKSAYPEGRYRFHRFPSYEKQQRIFLLQTNSLYGFTNHHNDLYLYDEAMRREIIANVRGSFCWHTKLYSPNLQKFITNYAQCVENWQPVSQQLLTEDHQSCQQYCEDTPEMFSSEQCLSICDQAYQQVLRMSAEK